ncbi:MAG: HAMP domain-containing protein [Planctomyces sp.]|nr:HAMP domain-containing protein [Planctomyces sp.]
MSYRTIKRLLGETSLERKCRFLFGGALLLLITGSFYVYAQLNLQIVRDQYRQRARLLITQNLLSIHAAIDPEAPPDAARSGADRSRDLSRPFVAEEFRAKGWDFIYKNWQLLSSEERPSETFEFDVIDRFAPRAPERPTEDHYVYEDPKTDSYHYFEPIYAGPTKELIAGRTCYDCHQHRVAGLQEGDLMGVAKISFSLQKTTRDIARNHAVLIAMAIVDAFLAMLASYAIVRYVIVKPVQHLKEVSDSVAHGDLDKRADIRTGDEFEELSHAFNRMLRHLVNAQEELRHVNINLDAKVDELARANLSLHQMNKLKNEFLATMSHELRTPLNSILGFSDVLADSDNITDRQKKYLTNIQTSGRNLLSLINDILDLAKIEAGKMERHIVDFSISDLVERATAAMLPLAERKNIALQWRVDPAIPTLRQDSGKLQQVLYNLLSNAVKFTPEGGRVQVSIVPGPDNTLDLVVADTGVGIPLEDQAMIFEKFRQGRALPGQQDALTREYEGTGLGLSIVKELTRLLGGEVSLESEFGKGSTFTVRIPIQLDCPLDFAAAGEPEFETDGSPRSRMLAFGGSAAGAP